MGILQEKTTPTKPKYEPLKPLKDYEEVPIPAFLFFVEVDTVPVAFFQSCTGLEVTREVMQHIEGGVNNYVHQLPGQISFGRVTLSTGFTSSDFFWKWMMDGQADGWAQRKDFFLVQRRLAAKGDKPYEEVKRWNFHNAFPSKWKISDLSVTDSQKMIIETLELCFDYFEPSQPA